MSVATAWHEATVRQLHDLLSADPAVEVLALVGSGAQSQLDACSDLDVLVVVRPDAFDRFFPALAWLAPLGRIYGYEQHRDEFRAVLRVCFEDLRRLDIIVTTRDTLTRPEAGSQFPLAAGSRVLVSRAPAVDAVLASPYAPALPNVPDEAFDVLENGFWFKATIAVQKVARGDLLVALHLSLGLIQDCLVLAMLLRDRTVGMTQHRGGVGNEAVAELEATLQSYTAAGILERVEQSAIAFDRLAVRWSNTYEAHRGPLQAWIEAARRALRSPQPPQDWRAGEAASAQIHDTAVASALDATSVVTAVFRAERSGR